MIYQIEMSKGPPIKIDEEDLAKIKANIGESLIAIKQGIINPSFMISITPTTEAEFTTQRKVEMIDGRPTMKISENVRALADKMNINNNQLS